MQVNIPDLDNLLGVYPPRAPLSSGARTPASTSSSSSIPPTPRTADFNLGSFLSSSSQQKRRRDPAGAPIGLGGGGGGGTLSGSVGGGAPGGSILDVSSISGIDRTPEDDYHESELFRKSGGGRFDGADAVGRSIASDILESIGVPTGEMDRRSRSPPRRRAVRAQHHRFERGVGEGVPRASFIGRDGVEAEAEAGPTPSRRPLWGDGGGGGSGGGGIGVSGSDSDALGRGGGGGRDGGTGAWGLTLDESRRELYLVSWRTCIQYDSSITGRQQSSNDIVYCGWYDWHGRKKEKGRGCGGGG